MPRKPPLIEFGIRNSTICQSCLYNIRRQAAALPLAAAYSSRASPKAVQEKPRLRVNSPGKPPSKTEMQSYIRGIQALGQSVSKEKNVSKDDSDEATVRYFEEDEKGRTELEDEKAFEDSFNGFDARGMTDALTGLEAQLETNEEKSAFRQVLHEMGKGIRAVSSPDDLEKILASMDDYNKSIDDEIRKVSAELPEDMLKEMEIDIAGLTNMESQVEQEVSRDEDEDELYEEEEEQQQRRTELCQIPIRPWGKSQNKRISKLNVELSRVSRKLAKINKLSAKDVLAVYRAYNLARLVLAKSWNSVPLDVWDVLWRILSWPGPTNPNRFAHVSMLARDMSKANASMSPPQQLMTIEALVVDGWEAQGIDTWRRCVSTLGSEAAETYQDFWALGVRMFCLQGDMKQAERCVNKLLSRGLDAHILMPIIRAWSEKETPQGREQAWAAYRQMRERLDKRMGLVEYDQVISCFLASNQAENALHAFVDMMTGGEIDLKRLPCMPPVVGNKFFLGKWLKRLIGAGDVDGAHKVVQYMRSKGIEAAPIQVNGLIGAWQRSGGAADLEKADKLAWEMIESRIAFVRARGDGTAKTAKLEHGTRPRATLETFCLLAENYRVRDLHEKMKTLWESSREAQICPDAFMMNQLLESYIQAGQAERALALYEALVTHKGVVPDGHTFSALWKTLAINQLHTIAPGMMRAERTATRRLFAQTVEHRAMFMAQGGMDGQLARKMLHTFRRMGDGAGFAVALAALRDLLGFLPADTLAAEVMLGTTKLVWETAPQRRRLLQAKRELDAGILAAVGGDETRLEDSGLRARAVCEYLQQRFLAGGESDYVREAAREMGVFDLLDLPADGP
ncbi:hypothetical protein CDD82_4045 [Ophiocordyceps australis]|uniref:Pentacotripeptide-repeat region of PRORP domain-containing protein n=1 Tax=Ophiocordyceps australis TaxID=1399860 RepID=A0A2C5Z8G9_9HYPO|nr:hypothetical protein CDD82_4045 [Ophiocordyceps australis]